MKLYLLRHGETYINREGGRFQGQIDNERSALTEEGKEQAREAGQRFSRMGIRFDRVISSPQERAVETAHLASGMEKDAIETDARLKELNFGPFEGKKWEEMNPATFHALMKDGQHYYPGAGMESLYHLVQRSAEFLENMKHAGQEETILVSTHGGAVRGMLVHLHLAGMSRFWDTPVGNCAWFELTLKNGMYEMTDKDDRAEYNP